jgi:CRISPR/Cas system-associated protein Cas5 (RAMP superfamily)
MIAWFFAVYFHRMKIGDRLVGKKELQMKDTLDPEKEEARRQRAKERRGRIVTHRASNFDDAEQWDLEYWQSKTSQERLSALVDIRNDIEKVERARHAHERQHRS